NPRAGFETPVSNTPVPDDRHRHIGDDDIPVYHDDGTHSLSTGHSGAGGAYFRHGQGAQAYGLLGDVEPIMSCDTNFDSQITKPEFEQCAARRFVALDANRDGAITLDEVHLWISQAPAQQ